MQWVYHYQTWLHDILLVFKTIIQIINISFSICMLVICTWFFVSQTEFNCCMATKCTYNNFTYVFLCSRCGAGSDHPGILMGFMLSSLKVSLFCLNMFCFSFHNFCLGILRLFSTCEFWLSLWYLSSLFCSYIYNEYQERGGGSSHF